MDRLKEFGGQPGARVWVGIDPSLTGFGMTFFDGADHVTWVYGPRSSGAQRLDDIARFVERRLEGREVAGVCLEGTVRQSLSASVLGELAGVVKLTLHRADIPFVEVPPTSLKKYIAGRGAGVSKAQILLHVYKKWGVEFTDDNAADSYGLARLASGGHKYDYEQQVAAKLGL